MSNGWVGYDLDGTLAFYDHDAFPAIGKPIPAMIARLKADLSAGNEVRVFTARVSIEDDEESKDIQIRLINNWMMRHIGRTLPITCIKDFRMIRLYDDRAYHVIPNQGIVLEP